MEWLFDTQLIGVIVGFLLTMVGALLSKGYESQSDQIKLKSGLREEVRVFRNFVASDMDELKELVRQISFKDEPIDLYITSEFQFNFLESKMGTLGLLNPSLISNVIQLNGLKNDYTGECKKLTSLLDDYPAKYNHDEYIIKQIDRIAIKISDILILCDEVIKKITYSKSQILLRKFGL